MLEPIEIKFKLDKTIKRAHSTELMIKSHDINVIEFHISFDGLELTADRTVKVLSVFNDSKSQTNVICDIVGGKAIYRPDTSVISQYEYVQNYVYVYHGEQSLDVRLFTYIVDSSEIDKTAIKVKTVYDQSYAELLTEFEARLQDYKDSLPQASDLRAEVDVILNKFKVDSQNAIEYLGEVSTAVEIAEAERKEAEILREENYNQKVDTAIVEADVVSKVDNKVTELTPQINNLTAQLAQRVTHTELDAQLATLLDGGPSIFMDSLALLQSTYPNGASGVALVRETDPAKIYVWSGSQWEYFGEYQGIEVKDNTITSSKLSPDLQSLIKITSAEGNQSLVGTLALPTGTTRFNNLPVTTDGYVKSINFNVKTAGTAKIKVLRKNNDRFYVVNDSPVVITTTGLVTLSEYEDYEPFYINQGDYLGWYGETAEISYTTNVIGSYSSVLDAPINSSPNFAHNQAYLDYNYIVERDGALKNSIEELESKWSTNEPVKFKFGNDDISDAGLVSGAFTRIDNNPVLEGGVLESVKFRTTAAGTIKIKFLERVGDTFTLKKEITIQTRPGLQVYNKGEDFESVEIEAGWFMGTYSADGQPKVPFSTLKPGVGSWTYVNGDITSSASGLIEASYNLLISIEVLVGTKHVKESLGRVERELSHITSTLFTPQPTLLNEDFDDAQLDNWVIDGFEINNGLHFNNGVSGVAYTTQWSTMDHAITKVFFTPMDGVPDLAIYKRGIANNVFSNHFRFDGVNKKLQIYELGYPTDTVLRPVLSEIPVTIPIVVGRQYILELARDTMQHTIFRLIDTLTGESAEVVNNLASSGKNVMNKGYTGVVGFGGNFTVNRITYGSREKTNVKLAIYGDSFVEASTLAVHGIENSYSNLLKESLNGDVHINGSGGETSTGLVHKLPHDFDAVKAKYTLLAIGTNDNIFTTWVNNIQQLIDEVEKRGSIPILTTLSPRGDIDKLSINNQINSWVRGSGQLYVDIALVTSLNFDGETFNPTLFFDDKVHPNLSGHRKIYDRFLVDVPEVLDGY